MTIVSRGPAAPPGFHPGPYVAAELSDAGHVVRQARVVRLAHHVASEGGVVAVLAFGTYFVAAMLLDFHYHVFPGDAVARMANGFYTLHSRDPHLAAMGFVWNPLSSLAVLPVLAFNSLWSPLAANNVAGTLVSALAMAGAAYQVRCIFSEWGVATLTRLVMVAIFAVNPMVIYYGGNGMSEALYLFTMVGTLRYLLRWMRLDDLRSLVYAASFLALAYLGRSEPMLAAIFAAPLVFGLSYHRSSGHPQVRSMASLTDATIFLLPIVTTFAAWAVASYIIVGHPFEQLSAQFGNTSLIAQSGMKAGHYGARLLFEAKSIEYLGPALAIIVTLAVIAAAYRRDIQILAIGAILGGGLLFTVASYLDNSIFPFYRYFILVVPIEVILVGSMFGRPLQVVPARPREGRAVATPHPAVGSPVAGHTGAKVLAGLGATVVAVLLLVPSIPATAAGMFNPGIGTLEVQEIGAVFATHPNTNQKVAISSYKWVKGTGASIDAMHLPNGSIVVNNANRCIPELVTRSSDPRVFVIPNDRDFARILADPLTFHAHYLLLPKPSAAPADSIDLLYPTLFKSGAGISHLVTTFPAGGRCVEFLLYRVTGHPRGTY